MQALWNKFWREESGQGLTEYALIIALVAIALIALLLVFRNGIANIFRNANQNLNTVAPSTLAP